MYAVLQLITHVCSGILCLVETLLTEIPKSFILLFYTIVNPWSGVERYSNRFSVTGFDEIVILKFLKPLLSINTVRETCYTKFLEIRIAFLISVLLLCSALSGKCNKLSADVGVAESEIPHNFPRDVSTFLMHIVL